MCGIVGYIGSQEVSALLIDGLKRLEYRGYDSWGLAMVFDGSSKLVRSAGRIADTEENALQRNSFSGTQYGIGHTRWATHGCATEANAHPHTDCTKQFMVAHNGIIDNYFELRQQLIAEGHVFGSETDSEVLPHLIERNYRGNLEDAVIESLEQIEGAYGIAVVSLLDKEKIVVARKGPPLVIGLGDDEAFIASDIPAVLPHTRQMLFLEDGEVAVVRRNGVNVRDMNGLPVLRAARRIDWTSDMVERDGYPTFMLKEIFEQPRAIRDTFSGRLSLDGRVTMQDNLGKVPREIDRIAIVACGTSLHAAIVGKTMIERLAGIPVDVEYASEFRYREPLLSQREMVIAISQSGETADTLAAAHEARSRGAHVLAISNAVGSMITRQADSTLYTHAGPEIGVASTKAFTTQLTSLYLLALFLAQRRNRISREELARRAVQLYAIPDQIEGFLGQTAPIEALAERICWFQNSLYLGRGIEFPVALEGALKLKEISYIHAEGYPAGEMKHGPIALIDPDTPVIALATRNHTYSKMLANIQEVKARKGLVFAIGTEGDSELGQKTDSAVLVPASDYLLSPLLSVIPLQLLAYHVGIKRGCDVDKPRNLAKSVTVE